MPRNRGYLLRSVSPSPGAFDRAGFPGDEHDNVFLLNVVEIVILCPYSRVLCANNIQLSFLYIGY